MAVKKSLIVSISLFIIAFCLIIQPNLVLCEEMQLKIFGIPCCNVHYDTSGQEVGWIILNVVIYVAIFLLLFAILMCTITKSKAQHDVPY
jgi:hypothetical protein